MYSADVDGDGDLDVLSAANSADDITWWENTAGNGSAWTEHVIDGNFDAAYGVYSADMDGDGDIDVIGAALGADDITWWENTAGDGSAWTEHLIDGNFDGARAVYAADVDGDGYLEVLAAGSQCDDIAVYNLHWWDVSATARISVSPDNDDPTAEDDDGTIAKPTTTYTTGVLITDPDTDYADLVVTFTGSPSATGTLTYNGNGTFTYSYTGAELSEGQTVNETFTYTVKDTDGAMDDGTITVTVKGTNDDPTASDDTGAVTEPDTTYTTGVLITDPDTAYSLLSVDITGNPSATGTLVYNGDGTFTYTYTGAELPEGQVVNETFTYTVEDTDGSTAGGTITVTVTGVNDDPVAADDAYNVTEDLSVSGNVITDTYGQDSDIDGDSLTATLLTGPAYGTLTEFNADGSFTYVADDAHWDTLAEGETEDVTFTYEISDGKGGTDTATVTITVTGTNDDPAAADDAYNVTEDLSVSGNVIADTYGQDSDIDGDSLTATLLSGPAYGTLTEFNSDGSFTYVADDAHWDTLAEGETEDVTFTYEISDGHGGTDTATVTITVTGTNDDPVADNDAYDVTENSSISGNVITDTGGRDSDVDGDSLTATLLTGPAYGTLTEFNADGSFTYVADDAHWDTLAEGETENVTFTYEISDGNGGTDTATVTITVTGVNDDPAATDDAYNVTEDSSVSGNVITDTYGQDSDIDGDSLTAALLTGPAYGTLTEFNADGSFTYIADDAHWDTLAEGETEDVTFTYEISDGNGGTDTATVTITVTGVNDDPVADNDAYDVTEDSSVSGNVIADTYGQDSDIDGDSLTATLVSGPAHGTLTEFNADGSFTYVADDPHWDTLAEGATEDVTFTYEISDAHGGTDTATVTITVTGVNDDPVAADDAYNVTEDSSVTGNVITDTAGLDSDIDGDSLTATLASGPTYGTLTDFNSDGCFTYVADDPHWDTLAEGATEDVTFTYEISDGHGGTDTATVTITVTGTNDDPVAGDDAYDVTEDSSVSGNVITDTAGLDSDVDGDSLTATLVTGPAYGTLTEFNSDGSFAYVADDASLGYACGR